MPAVLIASSDWGEARSSVTTTLLIGQTLRAMFFRRRGLIFDSRFHPADGGPPRDVATLYLVLEGHVAASTGAAASGPCFWILDEAELERRTAAATTFRSWGEPLTLLNICVPRSLLLAAPGLTAGPRALPDRAWDPIRRMAETEDVHAHAEGFRRAWDALAEAGVVRAADELWTDSDEPPHLVRLFRAVSAAYRAQNLAESIEALADLAGVSVRQLRRDIATVQARHGAHGGFRNALRVLRVRRATLLLSAPDLSLSDITRAAGYGSQSAMGRAFRDAGLPPPVDVRRALLTSPESVSSHAE